MLFEVGTVLEGKVTGITKFGAFVALPGGKSGMVHISEVANSYVNDIHDHLQDGQTVKVKVLSVTPDGKINLSVKKAMEPAAQQERPRTPESRQMRRETQPGGGTNGRTAPAGAAREYQNAAPRQTDSSFEDKLKQFMQESDSKISGSRLYEQQRKSSRRRRD